MKTMNSKKHGLNMDQTLRDSIVGLTKTDYFGGVERYDGLTLDKLQALIDNRFIDLDERQNDSPTVAEFYDFMKDHPEVKAHGYVVSASRDDYRVSIEGLECHGPIFMATMLDFVKLCRYADDFVCEQNELYSWWD